MICRLENNRRVKRKWTTKGSGGRWAGKCVSEPIEQTNGQLAGGVDRLVAVIEEKMKIKTEAEGWR